MLVEWKASTEFILSRVVACDEERLIVLSPEGRLHVFELVTLNSSRIVGLESLRAMKTPVNILQLQQIRM